ncbi:hypothetical protein [Bartonella rattaustraliani]|nr:hypothetical protein [Bartonella rattaustraliani]
MAAMTEITGELEVHKEAMKQAADSYCATVTHVPMGWCVNRGFFS